MTSSGLLRALRQGLMGGMLVGALHVGLLARAGLYATADPGRVVGSLLRWMGLLGVLGGLAALGAWGLFALLPGFRAAHRRRRQHLGLVPFALYAAVWAVVLAHGAKPAAQPGRETMFAVALGLVGAALLMGFAAAGFFALPWDALRRRGSTPRGGGEIPSPGKARPRDAWVTLGWAVATVLCLMAPRVLPARVAEVDESELREQSSATHEAAAAAAFEGRPRNLLLITVDTLRADHLGCYGYARDTSPAIDALASRGVRLEQVLCPRPTTSPSFATFFTGSYPVRHGVHFTGEALAAENLTLAEILKEAGYATAAVITNGNLFPVFQFDQGFDTYVYGHTRAGEGLARVLEWLEHQRPTDRPWFLWFHSTDPHTPYNPLPPYDSMFATPGSPHVERQIELYDGEIRYTDDQIAKVLEYFDQRPALWTDTFTVFTSDHGESLDEHDYYFQHGELPYEPSARIPLIFVAPGVLPAGVTSSALVTGADLLPTVLRALHVQVPEVVHGGSILPALLQLEDLGPRDFVLLEAGFGEHIRRGRMRALRRLDTKYVQRLTRWAQLPDSPTQVIWSIDASLEGALGPDEVYDLTSDPEELVNLLGADPEREARERAVLDAFARHLAAAGQIQAGPAGDLDAATLESLKSLGYID